MLPSRSALREGVDRLWEPSIAFTVAGVDREKARRKAGPFLRLKRAEKGEPLGFDQYFATTGTGPAQLK